MQNILNATKLRSRLVTDRVRQCLSDVAENYRISRMRQYEIKKYRDPRRIAIANEYILSDEQKEQIDDLFVTHYGEKVGYIWHQNYAAHAGSFDSRFIPELLYIPEFEFFQNRNIAAVQMMGDKNFLPLIANSVGIKMPQTILSCTNGLFRDGDNCIITEKMALELLSRQKTFFIKPSIDTSSGQGCMKLNINDVLSLTRSTLHLKNGKQYAYNFVAQEIVVCHESIQQLYPCSVNTFRIITYLWHNKVEVMPIIIRIGRGGNYLDNAHAGGMFCAVQENGYLGCHAVTEFNEKFFEHPDTHVVFSKHRIEKIDSVVDAARKMHSAIPQIGVVNWDFTLNDNTEPVLIESNVRCGSVWLPQMAHGKGAFGERTEDVLQWLRELKKIKPHKRLHHGGGY